MQKTDTSQATNAHRKVGASTTLNRKYVKKPQVNKKISHFNDQPAKKGLSITVKDDADLEAERQVELEAAELQNSQQLSDAIEQQVMEQEIEQEIEQTQPVVQEMGLAPVAPEMMHPLQAAAINQMNQRKQAPQKLTAKQIKDREIRKALASSSKKIDKDIAARERAKKRSKLHFGIARVMLAVSCTAVAVLAVVYFVGTNMPDISMRVTAMQSGINASYPGYVPRGYNMTDMNSEDGKVVLHFENDETGDKFTMTEENSSWDSNALLTNYVKPNMGDDYTIVREQGLTIYATDQEAAWVNGGVAYDLKIDSGKLTKKQIKSIAVSL